MKGLSFNDITLIPAPFCEIDSRRSVDPSVKIESLAGMRVPVISSNMDTVYSPELARAIVKAGGIACTHRFCTIEENVKQFNEGS